MITKAKYDTLPPYFQGYYQYEEGALPGSELKDLSNPYPDGSRESEKWTWGQLVAAISAQEGDD